MDQALFSALRATGQEVVIQTVWVYEHPVDLDGLRRFHGNLGNGLLGRRIERSPLPFGRHRWIGYRGPEIDMADTARPRAEFSAWADEHTQLPIDPEVGPSWRLGVLPMTDGSTAVSLVVSHCLIDGLGCGLAIAEAVMGHERDLGYPPPRSRTRARAVVEDVGQTVWGLPEVGRAIVAAAKQVRRRRGELTHPQASASGPAPTAAASADGDVVVVPSVWVSMDLSEWDARAAALGGTSHALATAFAVRLAEQLGRRRSSDGAVVVQIPLSDRTDGDTRANALSYVSVTIDPTRVTTDLTEARAAVREVFKTLREAPPEESLQIGPLAPLVPFTPQRAVKRLVDMAFNFADLPVGCSNLGDLHSVILGADGTDAEYINARAVGQHVKRSDLEHTLGQLATVSGRVGGKFCVTVVGYQPGRNNSKAELRQVVAEALGAFGLTGAIE